MVFFEQCHCIIHCGKKRKKSFCSLELYSVIAGMPKAFNHFKYLYLFSYCWQLGNAVTLLCVTVWCNSNTGLNQLS